MSKAKSEDDMKTKLSKKIAELSTVIQVLFMRNHERELELMATKKLYEEEIKRVSDEGRNKLDWLEKQLDQLERFRTLLEMKTEECERSKATVDAIQQKQLEAELKVNERGLMLDKALSEIQSLKSEISKHSPEALEKLKREKEELTHKLTDETSNLVKQKELVKDLQIKVDTIEMNLNDMLEENDSLKSECSRLQEELTDVTSEIGTLARSLQDARHHGERALLRTRKVEESNKQITHDRNRLERHNKQLNEEVQKLLMEQQLRNKPFVSKKIEISQKPYDIIESHKTHARSQQQEDEVQFLKKEIEKYRLELKNREINFNRVFAEKRPLVIKKDEQSTVEDLRMRNLTGVIGYKKTFTSLPSVLNDHKTYGYHPSKTKR